MNANTITLHTENGFWITVYDGPGAADIEAAHGKTVIITAYKATTPRAEVIARFKAIYPAWNVRISPTQYTGATPTPEWVQRQTLLTVARMASEITEDFYRKVVPCTVNSFSALHEYGGFCDDDTADKLIAAFGGRDPEHNGMPDAYMEFVNNCQEIIGQWLKARTTKAGESPAAGV